jgi:3-deoxy-D-manno-octulosonic-acid transferase
MLWLYRLLFLPAVLLAAPYYLLRMRRRGGYAAHFGQRFGATPALPAKRAGVRRIWLQAVSVGEMLAIAPLLDGWAKDAAVEVYLTTTTSTAYALAAQRYAGRAAVIGLGYFPLDCWFTARRTWRAVEPDLVILTEGERWPEHLAQAASRGVAVAAVNARLSDRSFRRMSKLGPWARLLTRGLTRVLAASAGDAERFAKFGVPPERIIVTGNLKLDVELASVSDLEQARFRAELGLGEARILMGASTWPGEEAALLSAWRALRATEAGREAKLLIVPRHAERRGEIEEFLKAQGVRYHLRSSGPVQAGDGVDVAVADTTGELQRLLALAEVVFVGKTLPPHTEGQTPVEAAARGRAVLFGPGTASFRVITAELLAVGAARRVEDAPELAREILLLWADDAARAQMGAAGRNWHEGNRGAAARTRAALADLLRG